MNKEEIGEKSSYYNYYEMEAQKTFDAETYDDVASESAAPVTCERQGGAEERKEPTHPAYSWQSDAVMVQRLLCVITAVVAVSFLTAVVTLILALTMIMSRNSPTASTPCAAVQASTSAKTNLAGALEAMKKNISHMVDSSGNTRALWQEIQKNRHEIMQLNQRMINISKSAGPRGPPGYNGTQGSPGVTEPVGSVNLSLCLYKEAKSAPGSSGSNSQTEVIVTETNGAKFIAVNCRANNASIVHLQSTVASDGIKTYECECLNTGGNGASNMDCYIRYWECPT